MEHQRMGIVLYVVALVVLWRFSRPKSHRMAGFGVALAMIYLGAALSLPRWWLAWGPGGEWLVMGQRIGFPWVFVLQPVVFGLSGLVVAPNIAARPQSDRLPGWLGTLVGFWAMLALIDLHGPLGGIVSAIPASRNFVAVGVLLLPALGGLFGARMSTRMREVVTRQASRE